MNDKKLSLALVTGGGRRLGRAFALSLAREGYAILIHYHDSESDADQTSAAIQLLGVPVYKFQTDLTDKSNIESLFSYIDSLPYKIKVLVNSAAIMQKVNPGGTEDGWEATIALNLNAPYLLAQKSAERMVSGGSIINISDIGARKNWTKYPAYVVSKSALETMTRVLARTYAPKIRVNAIAPGLVMPSENVGDEEWKALVERSPLQRPVSLDEVVETLVFILRNEAVTGQVIVVDGGYSLA